MILTFVPFIISLGISYSNILPQNYVDYKVPLMLTVIGVVLTWTIFISYILLLNNHIEELEEKNKLLQNSSNGISKDIVQSEQRLSPSEIHHRLANLSQKEKDYLKEFIEADSRTLKFPINDAIADGLRSIGILRIVSTVITFYELSYSINPIYWDYIKKKPSIIN